MISIYLATWKVVARGAALLSLILYYVRDHNPSGSIASKHKDE